MLVWKLARAICIWLDQPLAGSIDRAPSTALDLDTSGPQVTASVPSCGVSAKASTTRAIDVEIGAGTFDLDICKKIFVDYTELIVGAGSRGAELELPQHRRQHSLDGSTAVA